MGYNSTYIIMVLYNDKLAKMILWSGYHTITLGPFIFTTKKRSEVTDEIFNHEKIHVMQWCEVTALSVLFWSFLMLALHFRYLWTLPICFVVYYIAYVAEYAIRRFYGGETGHEDYRHIGFEKEAYKHQRDMDYLSHRKPFAWLFQN